MEERWLSRKRRHLAPDIRDFITVHGKVVKPRLAANGPPSSPKLSKWQTSICRNTREQTTAFAYTSGVRKKAAKDLLQYDNKNIVPDCTACESKGSTTSAADATNAVTIVERGSMGDQAVTCSNQGTETSGALSNHCFLVNNHHTTHEIMNHSDSYSTFCSEDLGSIDPNLIDTEELLRELSD